MKNKYIILVITLLTLICTPAVSQEHETPNARQARRMFMEAYNMVYGPQGSQLHYAVNIIGIYKTEGTIWTKQKKSKFIDERFNAFCDGATYWLAERKKKTVTIFDADDDERDKYATKFKFNPDNYTYSIKRQDDGYAITLKAKRGVKGIKEARVLLNLQTRYPKSLRIKVGIFHTTIKISNVKTGGIGDDVFVFPREKYKDYQFIDKRKSLGK